MKKLICILVVLCILCGCNEKSNIAYTYEMAYSEVDMSSYRGVKSSGHCFKEILPSELYNCVDAKSSGVFYLGYIDCPHCQQFVQYLNEVGLEYGVTVYYINAYNESQPFYLGSEAYEKMLALVYDYTDADDNGEKCLWTPTVFSIINGQISGFQIGAPTKANGDIDWTMDNPSEDQIKRLKDVYTSIIEPFASKS